MSPELEELLEKARNYEMSDKERREQRIDFAYGNLALSDPSVTRASIERAADVMDFQAWAEAELGIKLTSSQAHRMLNFVHQMWEDG